MWRTGGRPSVVAAGVAAEVLDQPRHDLHVLRGLSEYFSHSPLSSSFTTHRRRGAFCGGAFPTRPTVASLLHPERSKSGDPVPAAGLLPHRLARGLNCTLRMASLFLHLRLMSPRPSRTTSEVEIGHPSEIVTVPLAPVEPGCLPSDVVLMSDSRVANMLGRLGVIKAGSGSGPVIVCVSADCWQWAGQPNAGNALVTHRPQELGAPAGRRLSYGHQRCVDGWRNAGCRRGDRRRCPPRARP